MPVKQGGLTLIELLLGLLVGSIVVTAALQVYTGTIKNSADNIKLTRLNQDIRALMDLMVRDIRRAGFVTNLPSINLTYLENNPFFSQAPGATTDITLHDSGRCILYAYNRDNDSPPVVDSNELLGFKLNNTNLEMRLSGTSNEDCDDGTWQTITEPKVQITALTFSLATSVLNATSMMTDTDGDGCYDGDDAAPASPSSSCKTGNYGNNICNTSEACNTCIRDGAPDPACLHVRDIAITLTGRLAEDHSVTQTITENVRVRNDQFLAALP